MTRAKNQANGRQTRTEDSRRNAQAVAVAGAPGRTGTGCPQGGTEATCSERQGDQNSYFLKTLEQRDAGRKTGWYDTARTVLPLPLSLFGETEKDTKMDGWTGNL